MENVLFKQTFRGFDRRQVLDYIDNISAEMTKQADEYTLIQKGLEEQIQTLSKKLSDSKDSLVLSRENITRLNEEIETLKQNNSQLKTRVTSYRNLIMERDKEIAQVKAEYSRISEKSARLEEENRIWKQKQDEIAACMVEANMRAKRIIDGANLAAEKTKAEFDRNAANLMDKVNDVRGEISRLEAQLEDSFNKLSNAMDSMDKASHIIREQVAEYRSDVDLIDNIHVDIAEEEALPQNAAINSRIVPRAKPVVKKTLTDTVLDTITRLLEK